MAKAKDNPAGETVEVPADLLRRMQERLEALERAEAARAEKADDLHPKQVYDEAWAKREQDISRPASERTQEIADRLFGTAEPRFLVRLDSTTEDGKPGPDIREHFPLKISGSSDLEAGARYLKVMGITKHDYRLVAEPVAA